jgi:hypothetical protein
VTPHRLQIHADPRRRPPGAHDGIPGDCLRACVASLLDVPYDTVPHFHLYASWWETLRRWTREHHGGDFAPLTPVDGTVRPMLAELVGDELLIGTGPSPRGADRRHAVLVDVDLALVHDPHPSDAGVLTVDEVYVPTLPYWPGPAATLALTAAPAALPRDALADALRNAARYRRLCEYADRVRY